MKLSLPTTTLAAAAILALAGTALPATLTAQASCPTPAATNAKPTWKHGTPEYNDFLAITKAADAATKAKLAAAFAEKYPDSDYKNQALQIEMSAQAQSPATRADAVKTAESLVHSSTADAAQMLAGYTVIAYLEPALVQPTDPDMAAKMTALTQAASCGEQLSASAPPASQAQAKAIFDKAQGFAELNTKQYDAAVTTLAKAAQENPTDPLPFYWMGVAEVTKPTPDYNTGIFYLAKASALAPQAAAISTYLNTVYTTYHGSTDGLQQVIATAKSNPTPPADFKVASKIDLENAANMAAYQAALEKQRNTLPPEDSFAGIEARLKRPELAAAEWKKVKGQGYELDGIVKAVTDKTADIAVGSDPNAPADVHLILFTPLKKLPKVGDKVTFSGAADAFKPNPPDPSAPFTLTMNQGTIKGYSPTAEKSGGQ